MPNPSSDKATLRDMLRRRRKALSPAEQHAAALGLADRISRLPRWDSARTVALYLAADGEIDTAVIATLARDAGKEIFLPVIREDDSLGFARWARSAGLTRNRYNIPEPPASAIHREPDELDIILLPLVGWDRSGGRLGMGGGFYDRTLANVSGPTLVGCAHGVQEVAHLPLEAWDVRLAFVATESALHDCRV